MSLNSAKMASLKDKHDSQESIPAVEPKKTAKKTATKGAKSTKRATTK